MRALSIRQPWAWLIVNGYKDVENRDWKRDHIRGEILIHASKLVDRGGYEFVAQHFPEIFPLIPAPWQIERGGIVGKATITDCVSKHISLWFFGKYGFLLENAKPLTFLPMNGQLGFFAANHPEANVNEGAPHA